MDNAELIRHNAEEYGFTPHEWVYGRAIRQCTECGVRETYWDDAEYPIDPCEGRKEGE